MYCYYPELKITDPNGKTWTVRLDKRYPETRYTVGRYENDIILVPEDGKEDKLISRWDHCIISRESGGWFVKDNSTWGTILMRNSNEIDLKIFKDAKECLLHEDIIKIQGWQLQFLDLDPDKTQKPSQMVITGSWVFSVDEASLYEMVNGRRVKVNLAPSEEKMLHFMAERNLENNQRPTLCHYEELATAIQGLDDDNFEDPKNVVHNVAKKIRKKLKTVTDDDRNKWLKNEHGVGYYLRIYCED